MPSPTSHSRSDDQLHQVRIVGDQQHRALVFAERANQRVARVDVEMVGRLVEDQQAGRLAGGQRQQQARPLAAGEVLRRRVGAVRIQAEAGELGAHLRRRGLRQRARHVGHRRVGRHQLGLLVLGEIPDAQLAGAAHFAGERGQPAGDQLGEGGFAVAVGAEQGDAVVHVDARATGRAEPPRRRSRRETRSSARIGGASCTGSGNANLVGAASITVSITGRRASAFMRAWAWRALVALARNRSTNFCMCSRWAAMRSAARPSCIACSVRMRTNSV